MSVSKLAVAAAIATLAAGLGTAQPATAAETSAHPVGARAGLELVFGTHGGVRDVFGRDGRAHPEIWLDRTTDPNSGSWDGRLGLRRNLSYTDPVATAPGLYWRVCYSDGGIRCSDWQPHR